jgi:hypothetical protein
LTSDPTTEALGPILAKNPRGLIVAPDELTRWVMSMDQYKGGKGGDRPFYPSVWNGEPIYIDRAKHMMEPIAVPHPHLTIAVGMVPTGSRPWPSGAADRMALWPGCCSPSPTRPAPLLGGGIPDDLAGDRRELVEAIWNGPTAHDDRGRLIPHTVEMDDRARAALARVVRGPQRRARGRRLGGDGQGDPDPRPALHPRLDDRPVRQGRPRQDQGGGRPTADPRYGGPLLAGPRPGARSAGAARRGRSGAGHGGS